MRQPARRAGWPPPPPGRDGFRRSRPLCPCLPAHPVSGSYSPLACSLPLGMNTPVLGPVGSPRLRPFLAMGKRKETQVTTSRMTGQGTAERREMRVEGGRSAYEQEGPSWSGFPLTGPHRRRHLARTGRARARGRGGRERGGFWGASGSEVAMGDGHANVQFPLSPRRYRKVKSRVRCETEKA